VRLPFRIGLLHQRSRTPSLGEIPPPPRGEGTTPWPFAWIKNQWMARTPSLPAAGRGKSSPRVTATAADCRLLTRVGGNLEKPKRAKNEGAKNKKPKPKKRAPFEGRPPPQNFFNFSSPGFCASQRQGLQSKRGRQGRRGHCSIRTVRFFLLENHFLSRPLTSVKGGGGVPSLNLTTASSPQILKKSQIY
jgi:hypothetical protein